MEDRNQQHFRHILLYYFRKGKKAANAHRKICAVYGEDSPTERTCQKWFAKFRSGDFSIEDAPRSGRPTDINDKELIALVDMDRQITVRDLAERLHSSKTTIDEHLKKLGYVKKAGVWIPPE